MNAVYFRSESEAIDAITMMLSNYNIRFDTEVRSRYSPLYYDIFLPDGLRYVKRQIDQKQLISVLKVLLLLKLRDEYCLIPYQGMRCYISNSV